jgi:hypothetical protein
MDQPRELDVLIDALKSLGLELVRASSGTMDSGTATFEAGGLTIEVVKDRSQWMLEGDKQGLEPAGLWRAFDNTAQFRDALIEYARQRQTNDFS